MTTCTALLLLFTIAMRPSYAPATQPLMATDAPTINGTSSLSDAPSSTTPSQDHIEKIDEIDHIEASQDGHTNTFHIFPHEDNAYWSTHHHHWRNHARLCVDFINASTNTYSVVESIRIPLNVNRTTGNSTYLRINRNQGVFKINNQVIQSAIDDNFSGAYRSDIHLIQIYIDIPYIDQAFRTAPLTKLVGILTKPIYFKPPSPPPSPPQSPSPRPLID